MLFIVIYLFIFFKKKGVPMPIGTGLFKLIQPGIPIISTPRAPLLIDMNDKKSKKKKTFK